MYVRNDERFGGKSDFLGDGRMLGDAAGIRKIRVFSRAEVREVKSALDRHQKALLELVQERVLTGEETRGFLAQEKSVRGDTDRLGRSQQVETSKVPELRRKGAAILKFIRTLKRFPTAARKRAEKARSTQGLRLISRFRVSPPAIRVHEKEAARISFIVSEEVSSISCMILELEGDSQRTPARRNFKMNPTPGYHVATFDDMRNQPPPVGDVFRIRVTVIDKNGRREEVFDQIKVLNPHQKTVLPRTASGLALHSLRFDGKQAVLKDEQGNEIRVRAISGQKPNNPKNPRKADFTKPEFQWEEDFGPLPESKHVPGGRYLIRKDSLQHPVLQNGRLRYPSGDRRGGTLTSWGPMRVPLHPSTVQMGSNIRQGCCTRSEFFVHIDTKNDGTAGCIGVHRDDEGKFNQMMSLIGRMRNDLPVIVEYPP
jgi:hypothetical protein